MSYIPRLYTPRLCLRPFGMADVPRVAALAGDLRVAQMTRNIPHPYSEDAAAAFILSQQPRAAEGRGFTFAITLAGTRTPGREHAVDETGYVIGCIGFTVDRDPDQRCAELGYWVGVPYWGRGFATEAGRAVLEFGFNRRHLQRIFAGHYGCNPASGRVLQKLGMTLEGTQPNAECRGGVYQDLVTYGLSDAEWAKQRKRGRPVEGTRALQAT